MPQRRYICSFCARPFSRSEHKARHERSHTKEKPFHCEKCDSSFVRRDLLQRHLRTVHSKDNKKIIKKTNDSINQIITPTPLSLDNKLTFPDVFKFNEQNIISLLTLSKKFNNLPNNAEHHFLTWATRANEDLPIIQMDQLHQLNIDSNLLYSILAFGAIYSNDFNCAVQWINKSWVMILKETNNSESIQSLTIISFIYLHHYQKLRSISEAVIPIEIIMDYLDSSISTLINHQPVCNYWFIFNILCRYSFQFNKSPLPSNSYNSFLQKTLPSSDEQLSSILNQLAKSSESFPKNSESKEIVLSALSAELQALKFNTNYSFYKSKEFIHNAIIMTNKAMTQQNSNNSSSPLITIFKRNLLLNCPLKFQDLIMDYISLPLDKNHWILLQLTLREFNMEYNEVSLTQTLQSNSSSMVSTQLLKYLDGLKIGQLNNNLGLTSLPLLFLGFLNDDVENLVKIDGLNEFILENYLVLLNIMKSLSLGQLSTESVVLQSIIYLIYEMAPEVQNSLIKEEIHNFLQSGNSELSKNSINFLTSTILNNLSNWLLKLGVDLSLFNEFFNHIKIHDQLIVSPLSSGASSPGLHSYPTIPPAPQTFRSQPYTYPTNPPTNPPVTESIRSFPMTRDGSTSLGNFTMTSPTSSSNNLLKQNHYSTTNDNNGFEGIKLPPLMLKPRIISNSNNGLEKYHENNERMRSVV